MLGVQEKKEIRLEETDGDRVVVHVELVSSKLHYYLRVALINKMRLSII